MAEKKKITARYRGRRFLLVWVRYEWGCSRGTPFLNFLIFFCAYCTTVREGSLAFVTEREG